LQNRLPTDRESRITITDHKLCWKNICIQP